MGVNMNITKIVTYKAKFSAIKGKWTKPAHIFLKMETCKGRRIM